MTARGILNGRNVEYDEKEKQWIDSETKKPILNNVDRKEIQEEVVDAVESLIDIASADDLKWASNFLSKAAEERHEAEKIGGG